MGGINHYIYFFSRKDERQFRTNAFVVPTNEMAVGVAPAVAIGRQIARWCVGSQYPENGIDELHVIHRLITSAAFSP
ncbi:hypothetical protein [Neisseria dentiae]|uniref:hypothetical protein n=1 Tax=Neisseria dentiae TaxID=194197 RepID=UPI001180BCEC|nr:hypothetical protein [Neisseria dentiae]QMT44762.1 hypothetical protein H3L92_10005 [Neisseria dentiae]